MNYGRFTNDGKTFEINTPYTPTRWYNYIFNDEYIVNVSQTMQGSGSMVTDYVQKKITAQARHFYLLDKDSKEVFTPLHTPSNLSYDGFSCEHGLDHSEVRMKFGDLATTIRVFVPEHGQREIWTVSITNMGTVLRNVSLFSVIQFEGGGVMGGESKYLTSEEVLYKYSFPYHVFYKDKEKAEAMNKPYSYLFSTITSDSYDCSASRFYGHDGDGLPAAVSAGGCSNLNFRGDAGFIGAFEHQFKIKPGETQKVSLVAGIAKSIEEIIKIKDELDSETKVENEFCKVVNLWEDRCSSFKFNTPDPDFDIMMNYWLKKQVIYLTRLNRGSVQCPARNQLQDSLGYAIIDPNEALEYALRVLRRQEKSGFLQQWYATSGSASMELCKLKHCDAPVWLILCLIEIVEKCGDIEIYNRIEPYLDGGKGSLYEHILQAAFYMSQNIGVHGLCLMFDGDWTDPINAPGRAGRGESVWTTMALLHGINLLKILSAKLGDDKNTIKLTRIAESLDVAINTHCWEGNRYIVAFNDTGEVLGGTDDGITFLNTQTWAIICGAARGERLKACRKAIDNLETPFGSLLLEPAFHKWNAEWGRISVKQAGTTENGSVYCHGTMFKAYGDTVCEDGDAAYRSIVRTLPTNPNNPPESNSQVPLFVPNYYLGLRDDPDFGKSSLHYETGTAAWLIWVAIEHLAGIRATTSGVELKPCLPSIWDEICVTRKIKGEVTKFIIKNCTK